jgi:hypothetical protein
MSALDHGTQRLQALYLRSFGRSACQFFPTLLFSDRVSHILLTGEIRQFFL